MNEIFSQEVLKGLTSLPKYLDCKYLYNAKGDKFYQEKMAMTAYYLTDCEYAILEKYKEDIRKIFLEGVDSFQLIELGVGNGYKTQILLEHFLKSKVAFTYFPLDISASALDELQGTLTKAYPELNVMPLCGDFFETLKSVPVQPKSKKVVLFMGSNIGNFSGDESVKFLKMLSNYLILGDIALIGFDTKKSPKKISDAYTLGPNEAFYKNILTRINSELGGNFGLSDFEHYFEYDPISGLGSTFLISTKNQTVRLEKLDRDICFEAWEPICISIHQKYSDEQIESMAKPAGFRIVHNFYDCQRYFVDSIWSLVS